MRVQRSRAVDRRRAGRARRLLWHDAGAGVAASQATGPSSATEVTHIALTIFMISLGWEGVVARVHSLTPPPQPSLLLCEREGAESLPLSLTALTVVSACDSAFPD